MGERAVLSDGWGIGVDERAVGWWGNWGIDRWKVDGLIDGLEIGGRVND